MAFQRAALLAGCTALAEGLSLHGAGDAPAAQLRGEQDTVMALAAYLGRSDIAQFPSLAFINTLRGVGFKGNIFIGIWEGTADEHGYFERAKVTPKYIKQTECKLKYVAPENNYVTRNICTEDYPHLKLDNARWIYGRKWLQECRNCNGWVMYADFGDINFQQNPFTLLPDLNQVPSDTVYMTEEMLPRLDSQMHNRGTDTNHWFVKAAVTACYGPEAALTVGGKPMINIASSFGTREGMIKWLGQLEDEFEKNADQRQCDPVIIMDQGVLNYLVYVKKSMPYATSEPWGKWIVNTMGLPCSNQPGLKPDHSMDDIIIIDEAHTVWNEDGSLPAVVHQGKVCFNNYDTFVSGMFSHWDDLHRRDDMLREMASRTFPAGRKTA